MIRNLIHAILLITPAACGGTSKASDLGTETPKPGTTVLKLDASGLERTAHIYVPKGYDPKTPPPVVLFLHGAGGNGELGLARLGWAEKADKEGFLLVSPTGAPSRPRAAPSFRTNPNVWNSGQLNPLSPRIAIDDVAYIARLLDELKTKFPHDAKRVYVTGHSNGAGMTFRLATELPERFAAIAPVSGMLAIKNPRPKKPLPTLYIIGEKDPIQPLEGGEVTLPWGKRTNVPVASYLEGWAAAIGCEAKPKRLSNEKGVKREVYPSRSNGPDLNVIYVEGHGHEWPGGKATLPPSMVGPSVGTLVATDEIWNFFKSIDARSAAAR